MTYQLKAGYLEPATDHVLSMELQRTLMVAIFEAWAPPGAADSTTDVDLRAEMRLETRGASSARVYELTLRRLTEEVQAQARFTIRLHTGPKAKERADRERARVAQLARAPDYEAMACEILTIEHPLADTVLVYKHAASDYVQLETRLRDAILAAGPDAGAEFAMALSAFKDALARFDAAYDSLGRTQLVAADEIYHDYRAEFPPDLVIDARAGTCAIEERTLVLGEPAAGLSGCSLQQYIETIDAGQGEPPTAVRVDGLALRGCEPNRYASLTSVRLIHQEREILLILPAKTDQELLAGLEGQFVTLFVDHANCEVSSGSALLSRLGLEQEGVLPSSECLEVFKSFPTEMKQAVRHRDMHCKNIIASKASVKLVDLGDADYDLRAIDRARLETSLFYYLAPGLNLQPSDVEKDDLEGAAAEWDKDYPLSRFFQLVRATSLRLTPGGGDQPPGGHSAAEVAFAYGIQSLVYQRYLIERLLREKEFMPNRGLIAYLARRVDDLRAAATVVPVLRTHVREPKPPAAVATPSVAELWHAALSTRGHLGHDARVLYEALTRRHGDTLLRMPLTALQAEAWKRIASGESVFESRQHVIISGPTSSGKSTLAEMFLTRATVLGGTRCRSLYVAPTRALAQAKFNELKERFKDTRLGEEIVLSTGENTGDDGRILNANFSIACMVYEKANSMFSRNRNAIEQLACAVIDELHMLQETTRGPLLELAMAKLLQERRKNDGEHENLRRAPLRIVGISTEAVAETSYETWLSTGDGERGTTAPPYLIHSPARPTPIRHALVLRGRKARDFQICDIARFEGSSPRQLLPDELDTAHEHLRTALANIDAWTRSPSARSDERTALTERLLALVRFRAKEVAPGGYRALVFLPSRGEVERFAEDFRSEFKKSDNGPPAPELAALRSVLHRVVDMDVDHRVGLAAACGIFIHHSEVSSEARHRIESICAQSPADGKVQVMFATQTLSYGVNLAVDDVFLVGTQFNTTLRSGATGAQPLSECEYHNMLGRAGRLNQQRSSRGQWAPAAFVLVKEGTAPDQDILDTYYGSSGSPLSVLFVVNDRTVVKRSRDQDFEDESPPINAELFSYPFIRAVIDALRHLTLFGMGAEEGAGVKDLVNFIRTSTLYGIEALRPPSAVADQSESDRGRRKEEREVLSSAIQAILDAFSAVPVTLFFRVVGKAGLPAYRITPQGEAIVDSGTHVETIRPMFELIARLSRWWRDARPTESFPTLLHLLTLSAQNEVFKSCLQSAPEVTSVAGHSWHEDVAAGNRRDVLIRLTTTLGQLKIPNADEALALSLRTTLEEWTGLTGGGTFFGTYDKALVDAVIRLFCAITEWCLGGELSRVRELIVESSADRDVGRRLNGFVGFKNQVSWKAIMLSRVLAGADPSFDRTRPWQTERELHDLAVRARLGGLLQAVLLIDDKDPKRLTRDEAASLVRQGNTPAAILRGGASGVKAVVTKDQFVRLRGVLVGRARRDFEDLRRTWTSRNSPSELYQRISDFWSRVSEMYSTAASEYSEDAEDAAEIGALVREIGNWPTVSEGDAQDAEIEGLADVTRLRFRTEGRGARLEFEDRGICRRTAIVGFCFRPGWKVVVDGEVRPFDDVLKQFRGEPNVTILGYPWLPSPAGAPVGELSEFAQRAADGKHTRIMSPAAFCTTLCAVARKLMPIERAYSQLLGGGAGNANDPASSSVGALGLVTCIKQVQAAMLSGERGREIPHALREGILSFMDLGFDDFS